MLLLAKIVIMRLIGTLTDKKQAERFVRFLGKEEIESEVRETQEKEYSVWVYKEDQLSKARDWFDKFVENPKEKSFDVSASLVSKKEKSSRSRYIDVRSEIFGANAAGNTATLVLLIASVVLTVLVEIPQFHWLRGALMYSRYSYPLFLEIKQGQIWRLVTPIFMHAGVIHLLFNMLWLHTLGGQIERIEGSRYLLAFVLLSAAAINTAQYLCSSGYFLGMSGVVYALFGFIWMNAKYEIRNRYEMNESTIQIMIIWLFVCLFLPNVANTSHFFGAGLGASYGFLRSGGFKAWLRRRNYRKKLK